MPENIQNLRLELHWGKLKMFINATIFWSKWRTNNKIANNEPFHCLQWTIIVHFQVLKEKGLNQ